MLIQKVERIAQHPDLFLLAQRVENLNLFFNGFQDGSCKQGCYAVTVVPADHLLLGVTFPRSFRPAAVTVVPARGGLSAAAQSTMSVKLERRSKASAQKELSRNGLRNIVKVPPGGMLWTVRSRKAGRP